MNATQLERQIERIKQALAAVGPMRPGSLSEQYNVCGTPGCRCKDPKKPEKHGPYYHLNYTWRGKARTEFVKAEAVAAVREQVENYKRFRALCSEWVEAAWELAQAQRAAQMRCKRISRSCKRRSGCGTPAWRSGSSRAPTRMN